MRTPLVLVILGCLALAGCRQRPGTGGTSDADITGNDLPAPGPGPIASGNAVQNAQQQVTPRRKTQRDGVAFDTPEKVFAAYSAALAKGDWDKAFSHLTPEYGDFYLFELAFGLGMIGKDDLIAEHQDPTKLTKLNGVEGLDEKQVKEMLVDSFKDKKAFYRAAQEVLAKDDPDHIPDGKLRGVKIDGERARGTTTHYIESLHRNKEGVETRRREEYQSPVYFKKVDGGWRIDMPSPEEERRDLESADGE